MNRKSLLVIFVGSLMLTAGGTLPTVAAALDTTPQQPSAYVGAAACKSCHTDHVDAWSGTKHSRTFSRLSAADRLNEKCMGCHVTGSPEMIRADAPNATFPSVQCEACHGAGGRHVGQAQAKAMTPGAIVKTPGAEACTRCHSDASPHYKPFFYSAMKGLVHPIRK